MCVFTTERPGNTALTEWCRVPSYEPWSEAHNITFEGLLAQMLNLSLFKPFHLTSSVSEIQERGEEVEQYYKKQTHAGWEGILQ